MPKVPDHAVAIGGNGPLLNLILIEHVYLPLVLNEVDLFNGYTGYKAGEQLRGERQRNVLTESAELKLQEHVTLAGGPSAPFNGSLAKFLNVFRGHDRSRRGRSYRRAAAAGDSDSQQDQQREGSRRKHKLSHGCSPILLESIARLNERKGRATPRGCPAASAQHQLLCGSINIIYPSAFDAP